MRPLRGIALKIGSVLMFIVMSSMIKATAQHIPPGQSVFFRSFFTMPGILTWLAMRGELSTGLLSANPLGHVWRGSAGTLAMGLGFAGLAYLPLPEVTAIGYAAPLLTVIFAAIFLNEEVHAFRISCVAFGLTGILVVLTPRLTVLRDGAGQTEALGAMLVLGGAIFAALAHVFVRKLVQTERTTTVVFWFSVTASGMSLVTLPFGWVIPTPSEAALLVSCGLLGGLGQILLTSSYREADASLVAPFDYASIVFAIAIGYFVFAEIPTATTLTGAALVITAGIMIILREWKLGKDRAAQHKAQTSPG
ncbi:MAG: DMT family transporter [Rhodobacteraceae bacterium]|nr:DMT family transporter [Paracoccaceae bacterium]